MNHDQAFRLASIVITVGALGQLLIACHAWQRGLPGVATGIALVGVVLLATVIWGSWLRSRPNVG